MTRDEAIRITRKEQTVTAEENAVDAGVNEAQAKKQAQDKHDAWQKSLDEAMSALEDPEVTEAVLVVHRKNGTELAIFGAGNPLFIAGAGLMIAEAARNALFNNRK